MSCDVPPPPPSSPSILLLDADALCGWRVGAVCGGTRPQVV